MMLSSYFSKWGVQHISDASQIDHLIKQSTFSESDSMRGSQILNIFSNAQQLLKVDESWKAKIEACISEFDVVSGSQFAKRELPLISEISQMLSAEYWAGKIELELVMPRALDTMNEGSAADVTYAIRPLGTVLHIAPGNSFLGGLDSILHGLVTGNKNIVRISQSASAATSVIAQLLVAAGLPKEYLTVVTWERKSLDITKHFKKRVDGIVVWGGHEVIDLYKNDLPTGVRFIEFGPKLSFSILTKEAVSQASLVDGIIADVCRYEQVSCSSTQVLFIESRSNDDTGRALDVLESAFKKYNDNNPAPVKSPHEQVEFLKEVERSKVLKILGKGDFRSGYPHWHISQRPLEKQISPSPLMRTLMVYSYESLQQIKDALAPIKHYLQTAGLACTHKELLQLTEFLWDLGVVRVTQSGRSTIATEGAPHDGNFILRNFCKIMSLEASSRSQSPWFIANDKIEKLQISQILRTAEKAPYYKRLFLKIGLDTSKPLEWSQFHKIPWLTKDDIYNFGPPKSDDLLTKKTSEISNSFLFTTGGSTGAPKFSVYSKDEWDSVTDIFCREFRVAGITKNDRMANLFTGGGLWSAYIVTNEALEKIGCFNIPLGGNVDPEQSLKIFKDFNVTAIFGLPTTILKIAHTAHEHPELRVKISKVLYGGEHMTPAMRNFVKEVFQADIVKSGSYAAVDAGCIGYQCPHQSDGFHHALEGYCHVEVADEATGLPVQPGEEGELIVTNISRKLFPIIRLKTGDRARQVLTPCPCGSPAMSFELLGRSDDMIRVGGANVYVSDVDRLCQKFPDKLSYIYQLKVSKVGVDDALEVGIEVEDHVAEEELPKLEETVKETYLSIADEVQHYLKDNLLKHFKLKLLRKGTLPTNNKTQKMRRVVDSRLH